MGNRVSIENGEQPRNLNTGRKRKFNNIDGGETNKEIHRRVFKRATTKESSQRKRETSSGESEEEIRSDPRTTQPNYQFLPFSEFLWQESTRGWSTRGE